MGVEVATVIVTMMVMKMTWNFLKQHIHPN